MLHSVFCIFIIGLITLFLSCNRIVKKSEEVVDNAKEKIIEKKDDLVDKVFPVYDHSAPDTDNNKKRFKEHLQIDITNDVKNIYSYGDFLGADYKVLFTFTCNQASIDKIIGIKQMQLSQSGFDSGLYFSNDLKWWDADKIKRIVPHKSGVESEYWQYLWYDAKTRQAFYQEFSL
jgi:hypothetical protein